MVIIPAINKSNIDSFIKSMMNNMGGTVQNSVKPTPPSTNQQSSDNSSDSNQSSDNKSKSAFSSSNSNFDEAGNAQSSPTKGSNKENVDPSSDGQSSCSGKSAFGKAKETDGFGSSPTNSNSKGSSNNTGKASSPANENNKQSNTVDANKSDTKATPTSATNPTNSTGTPEQQRFLELVNNHRKANGLGPVKLSPELNAAAEKYSKTQSDAGKMGHSVDGTQFGDRAKAAGYKGSPNGENAAYNSADSSPEKIFEMWKNSPGHNANMLSKDATEIGYGTNNGYATQVLGIG
jgi:uncharacterized protein YkwD